MPAFSIIVPVHNAESTLERCLNSILNQTFPGFEVLMVENGSSDTSCAICRKYAETDARFFLHVAATSCGPSGARNIGLEHAQGQWITFVDSDDYIDPDYLASLHRAKSDADIIFFGYRQFDESGKLLSEHIPDISSNTGCHEILIQLRQQDLFGYTWIKAFRRDTIGLHRFSQALNLLEDEVFTCEVLTTPKRVAVVAKPLYNYITGNPGSLMGRTHPDYCQKVDRAYIAWKKLLQNYPETTAVLTTMANGHVKRCMYYGFEREVDTTSFFRELGSTSFFQDSTLNDNFCTYVKNRSFRKLDWMRTTYHLKIAIAKLLRK